MMMRRTCLTLFITAGEKEATGRSNSASGRIDESHLVEFELELSLADLKD